MPIVGLAVLGDLLFCLICLAVGYSIITFGKFIANLVPNIPIPFFHFRDLIIAAAEGAGGFLMDLTHGSFRRLGDWLVDAAYFIHYPLFKLIQVLDHHANQLSSIRSNDIPGAVNSANGYTNDHVAGEANTRQSQINAVNSDLHSAEVSLQNNIDTLAHQTVPADIASAKSAVESDLHDTATSLQNNIDSLQRELVTDLNAVWANVQPLQNAVYNQIPAEFAQAAAQTSADILAAKNAVVSQLTDAIATVNGEIATAVQRANDALSQAVQGIDAELNNAIVAEQTALANAKADVLTQLQSQRDTLQGEISIDNANIGTLQEATSITIPAAIAAVATGVATITSEFERCAVTTCDGPNNFRNLLNEALGLAGAVDIVAFLAAAAKDPSGEARAFAGVAEGIYNDAHSLIDGLLSL